MSQIEKLTSSTLPPKILIYGKGGVGKTVLACQAPKPLLFLDFDMMGVDYVGNVTDHNGTPLIDIDSIDVMRSPMPDVLVEVADRIKAGRVARYRTIVVDSLTSLQMHHRQTILGAKLQATQGTYGINTEWMRRLIRTLGLCNVTVVYTAQEDADIDEDRMIAKPSLTPALWRSIDWMIPIICRLTSEVSFSRNDDSSEVEATALRRLVTVPTEKAAGKDRTGLLRPVVTNPTWLSAFGELYPESEGEDDANSQ